MIPPRVLLAAHNLRAKKRRGQNFLTDSAMAERIVECSGISRKDIVLEIGAGLGALTIPAARAAKKVYAIDIDRQIMDILKVQVLASNLSNVVIMEKNILRLDIEGLAEKEGGEFIVMGNLPYNISSQVLIQLIESRISVKRAILMFQKELAQRITAQPCSKDYGRLTVMLQYCAEIKKLVEVKAPHFFPKPKVDSEVLEIRFQKTPKYSAHNEAFLFSVIKAAFGQRRKTLKNALAGSALDIDAGNALNVLENAGIDPVRRAETLSVQEFVKLSNALSERKQNEEKWGPI